MHSSLNLSILLFTFKLSQIHQIFVFNWKNSCFAWHVIPCAIYPIYTASVSFLTHSFVSARPLITMLVTFCITYCTVWNCLLNFVILLVLLWKYTWFAIFVCNNANKERESISGDHFCPTPIAYYFEQYNMFKLNRIWFDLIYIGIFRFQMIFIWNTIAVGLVECHCIFVYRICCRYSNNKINISAQFLVDFGRGLSLISVKLLTVYVVWM